MHLSLLHSCSLSLVCLRARLSLPILPLSWYPNLCLLTMVVAVTELCFYTTVQYANRQEAVILLVTRSAAEEAAAADSLAPWCSGQKERWARTFHWKGSLGKKKCEGAQVTILTTRFFQLRCRWWGKCVKVSKGRKWFRGKDNFLSTSFLSIWPRGVVVTGARRLLTSQSYNSLSCSMIHSSRTSLFRSSFLSYLTVTLPCFFCTGSSAAVMGPEPTQPTPVGGWKNTRLPAVGSGALVSVLAADITGCPPRLFFISTFWNRFILWILVNEPEPRSKGRRLRSGGWLGEVRGAQQEYRGAF